MTPLPTPTTASRRPPRGRRAALRQHGVSLVEALLALVVMSVGMLAVAGVQTTLRANGDLSRQRAEAVRIAQQSIEQRRGFVRVDETGTLPDYQDLGTDLALAPDVLAGRVNTAFTVQRTVVDSPPVAGTVGDRSPPMKTVVLRVGWDDRNAQRQTVSLFTTIAKSSPELAGSLVVPLQGSPARRPLGRQVAIPLSAEALTGDDAGRSLFRLPATGDGPAAGWIFNDLTGVIERICTNAADLSSCTVTTAQLVTGYVRLALPSTVAGDPAAMSADDARDPRSTAADLDAFLRGRALTATALYRTSSSATATYREDCFIDRAGGAGAPEYFCALPLYPSLRGTVPAWEGRIVFGPTPDPVAASPTEASADRLRACRYFALGESVDYAYTGVAGPLSQQNFVLARAGNGSVAYGCPGGATVSVAQGPG